MPLLVNKESAWQLSGWPTRGLFSQTLWKATRKNSRSISVISKFAFQSYSSHSQQIFFNPKAKNKSGKDQEGWKKYILPRSQVGKTLNSGLWQGCLRGGTKPQRPQCRGQPWKRRVGPWFELLCSVNNTRQSLLSPVQSLSVLNLKCGRLRSSCLEDRRWGLDLVRNTSSICG